MDLGLEQKLILVVGASKGIGRGIVMDFVQEHCRIVAIARLDGLLQAVKEEAIQKGAVSFDAEECDIMGSDTKELELKLRVEMVRGNGGA